MSKQKCKGRLLALLLALLTTAGLLFTGCGQNSSDTVKWINATYALLTTANGGDVDQIGGYKKNEANTAAIQEALAGSWGVADRDSADETLNWLLTEGHRASFAAEMVTLQSSGVFSLSDQDAILSLEEMGLNQELAACYLSMMNAYRTHGLEAIDAWDYCRALQLLGWYYLAGYYTEEETLDRSLEIAQQLQLRFSSWDKLVESYLWGYNYWAEDDPNDPESDTAARKKIYEQLKSAQDSPYSLSWNTALTKDW